MFFKTFGSLDHWLKKSLNSQVIQLIDLYKLLANFAQIFGI